ncbi:Imm26 family immunity protein [Rhodocyclus tenuis]|uniref:Immunity protein 26 n=1 Tax=Rhodocyclus tenuis TaxID=1066 RepID=A0A840GLX5_RHOTE|nr:Imm26 family immunity protein [Rhodocyclus tenuis]MBB4249149.1 hypothetical protein [Rhodocyclus tenuis]
MNKQRDKIGALFSLELSAGQIAFGRKVNKEESVFFDFVTDTLSPESIAKAYESRVAFRIPVMKYAVTSGRWKIVDCSRPVGPELAQPGKYFMQDKLTGAFSIYQQGEISPCDRIDVEGLECAAVWEPEHVEDRLRDYFARKPNLWFEQLKPV